MSLPQLLPLEPGLVAVIGDEGAGKTFLLRSLASDPVAPAGKVQRPDCLWLDLSLPGQDDRTPHQVWGALRQRWPRWDLTVQDELAHALGLEPHLGKKLLMLSTGTRRKVALVALLASGATVTCLDQPFAALDAASAGVLRDHLSRVAEHTTRTWVVADYEADPRLRWRRVVVLPLGGAKQSAK